MEHKAEYWTVICGYSGNKDYDVLYYNNQEEIMPELPDLIRRFGKEMVVVFPPLSNYSWSQLDIDPDTIESDRYPELDMAMDAGLVELYRGDRLLFTRPIEDLPHHIISGTLDSILAYLKDIYDNSLIDTYYLQE